MLFRLFLLLLMSCFLVEAASAQILRNVRDRVQRQVEERVEKRVVDAADRATERTLDSVFRDSVRTAASSRGVRLDGLHQAMAVTMGGAGVAGGSAAEPVDFRELRALLPETVNGLARTDARGERSSGFGMSTSQATGEYGTGDRSMTLTITDSGTLTGLLAFTQAWAALDIDQESDTGFERTFKLKGHPAHISYSSDSGYSYGQSQVIVGGRFIVALEASNVDPAELQRGLESVDIDKLDSMKLIGVKETAGVVDFRELRNAIPAQADGFSRGEATGERNAAMGIEVSQARATFTSGRGESFEMSIMDSGTGLASLGMTAWALAQIDRETDQGFERTTRFEGMPAFEKSERRGSGVSSEMQVIIEGRIIVRAEGAVGIETLRAAVSRVDFAGLKRLLEP
jgi:hypothetical protein